MDAQAWTIITLVADKLLGWPLVAIVSFFLFKPQFRALLNRLREGGGAKFDPLPAGQGGSPAVVVSTSSTALVTPFPRTPASQRWERTIRTSPDLLTLTDPVQREEYLVAAMARIMMTAQFDLAEAYIFGSQLALLGYLNIRLPGESANTLRQTFYEPATTQYPELYKDYPFDNYLAFLQRTSMVTLLDGVVQITEMGTEYLAWRANTAKPPRTRG
jgi:hypothetical protein